MFDFSLQTASKLKRVTTLFIALNILASSALARMTSVEQALVVSSQLEKTKNNFDYWVKVMLSAQPPDQSDFAKDRVYKLRYLVNEKKHQYQQIKKSLPKNISIPDKAINQQITEALTHGQDKLMKLKNNKGYWEGKAYLSAVLTAEYVLMLKYIGRLDAETARKAAHYLMRVQNPDGSFGTWDLGRPDIHWTAECWIALDQIGTPESKAAAARAKAWVDAHGGLEMTLPTVKFLASVFGYLDYNAPYSLLMNWIRIFPKVGINNLGSWTRCFMVPFIIINNLHTNDSTMRHQSFLNEIALKQLTSWLINHMDEGGSLYSFSMTTYWAIMAFYELDKSGRGPFTDRIEKGLQFLKSSIDETDTELIMRFPPLTNWDTPNAIVALTESGDSAKTFDYAFDYLYDQQILDVYGDWSYKNKSRPGGWGWMPGNRLYPDSDDSGEVLTALRRSDRTDSESVRHHMRAFDWLLGMQGAQGGWGAFDKDNGTKIPGPLKFTMEPEDISKLQTMMKKLGDTDTSNLKKVSIGLSWLNEASQNMGIVYDYPSTDVTGHALDGLTAFGYSVKDPEIKFALDFIKKDLGSYPVWYGRWGVDYFWATRAAVSAFHSAGADMNQDFIQTAVDWVVHHQNADGGWGQSYESLFDFKFAGTSQKSTVTQTSEGLLILLNAGRVLSPEAHRAAQFLIAAQQHDGSWDEPEYQCLGGQSLIKYSYLPQYSAMIALARYQNEIKRAQNL